MLYSWPFLFFFSCSETHQLSLPALFSDGAVLQQSAMASIWGNANPEEEITITASWGSSVVTQSDKAGGWMAEIQTPEAGGPFIIEVSTDNESIILTDILIGEVWLAAGQSNMEMDFDYCRNTTDSAEHEIATANFPEIRMFTVEKNASNKQLTRKGRR